NFSADDAVPTRAAQQYISRARPLQPVLHDARDHNDVPVCRADDGRNGYLPGPTDGRNQERGLSPSECVRLLDVSGGRDFLIRGRVPECRAGRRLVCLYSSLGSRVFSWQAPRFLGSDDYVHRGLGDVRRGRTHRDYFQNAGAGHVSEPYTTVLLVHAGAVLYG